jgi:hypothetical protein
MAYYYAHLSFGLFPALWLSSSVCITGAGTYNNPYNFGSCDTTPPTCTYWSPNESAWKTSGGATFTVAGCSDNPDGSGLNPANNYTCVTGGNHGDTCGVVIYDIEGNYNSYTSPGNRIDTIPPYLSGITCNGIDCRTNPYFNARDVTITYSGVGDNESGFNYISFYLYGPIEPSPRVTDLAAASISYTDLPDGSYIAHGLALDNVRNVYNFSDYYPGPFMVDTLPPTLTLNNSSPAMYSDRAQATVTAGDSLSGLASIYYRWNDNTNVNVGTCGGGEAVALTGFEVGVTSEWTSPSTLTPPRYGENILYACGIDRAGNIVASSAPYLYGVAQVSISSLSASDSGISLVGSAQGSKPNQSLLVWAAVCNTSGECLRKEFASFDSSTSVSAQPWTLYFTPRELAAGTYAGTIWVNFSFTEGAVTTTLSTQSNPVNFTLDPIMSTFPVKVFTNQAFSVDVGTTSYYDLGSLTLPATDHGVTATNNAAGNLILSSATGLTDPTTATFGNASFNFTPSEEAGGTVEVSF